MEPDLRATRNENRFYLNQDDQLHFRAMDEIDNDTAMPIPNLTNLSNPRGEDWQKWMDGQIKKPYNEYLGALLNLKNLQPSATPLREVELCNEQRLFLDIYKDYLRQWNPARKDKNSTWPKPLRMVLMGDPRARKCGCEQGN